MKAMKKITAILILIGAFSAWASLDRQIEVTLLLKKPVSCLSIQRQLTHYPFHVRCNSEPSRVYSLVYYGEPNQAQQEIQRLKTLKNTQEAQLRVPRKLSLPK